ncbi:MAG TPA: ABC transporter substrate-binding protein, partial [Gammaproteobacteria bacterium]|nr:ABC transporter substrate-binding protein [Gammaproteobacteria bacterium]
HLSSWDLVDGRMVIVPGIASKWELSNDGKTTTFTIREGAKFHDGTEITAEDVLWTFQHGMGPQAKEYSKSSPGINYSTLMDRIEQTGPDQVSVTTKVPTPELAVYISENEGGATQGQVMPKRANLHTQQDMEADDSNPIGAGPGKVVDHIPLQSIKFERFEDFYYQPENGFPTDKRYKFTELELHQIPEEATRAAAMQAGEADIARVSLATRQQVEDGGGRLVFSGESAIIESHLWGCWKPDYPCSDIRVRQALNYAIDKELMRDRLFGPEVMEIKGWWVVTPSTIGYSPELAPFPYDPDKARQLLAEAGYKTPTNPSGKDFGKLIINTYEDPVIPNLIESAQLTGDLWRRELGLDVEVRVMDKEIFTQTRTLTFEEFDGTVSWVAQNTRLDATGVARQYFLDLQKGGPSTRVHSDPKLFALMEETVASSITDQERIEEIFNSTYRQLQEEAYQISVGYINAPWGVGPRIVAWEPYRVAEYASAMHTIILK